MNLPKNLLVVLDHPLSTFDLTKTETKQKVAIERQAIELAVSELAQAFTARVTLLLIIYDRAVEIDTWIKGDVVHTLRDAFMERQKQALIFWSEGLRNSAIDVKTEIIWSKHFSETVLEYSEKQNIDLIISWKSVSHSWLKPLQKSHAQALVRMPNTPVLLLQNPVHFTANCFGFAIDVNQEQPDHENIQKNWLDLANSWGEALKSHLYLLNVYPSVEELMAFAPADWSLPTLNFDVEKLNRQRLSLIAQNAGLNPEHTELSMGMIAPGLESLCNKLEASLLIIGSHCRQGISGWMVGNTAESVVENTSLNLLILKA